MAERKTKDQGNPEPTPAEEADGVGNTIPGTNPETGTPGDVPLVKSLREAQDAAVAGEGDTTTNTLEDAYEKGYWGTSPVREATGLDDKGMSQSNDSVMNRNN